MPGDECEVPSLLMTFSSFFLFNSLASLQLIPNHASFYKVSIDLYQEGPKDQYGICSQC